MSETRTTLGELPDSNKLLAFDRNRHMVTMAANLEKATRPQLQEPIQVLVERVQAEGRTVEPESIERTPPARPFFQPAALLWRPRTDSEARKAKRSTHSPFAGARTMAGEIDRPAGVIGVETLPRPQLSASRGRRAGPPGPGGRRSRRRPLR